MHECISVFEYVLYMSSIEDMKLFAHENGIEIVVAGNFLPTKLTGVGAARPWPSAMGVGRGVM